MPAPRASYRRLKWTSLIPTHPTGSNPSPQEGSVTSCWIFGRFKMKACGSLSWSDKETKPQSGPGNPNLGLLLETVKSAIASWSARVRIIPILIWWEADSHYIKRFQQLPLSTKNSPLLSSILVKACWRSIYISLVKVTGPHMPHQCVRNAQEKSRCGIASMQTFSFTHPACAFLKKIKSSTTLMYLEPHKGHVITSCCQEYSAFFCQHSFRMCGLSC